MYVIWALGLVRSLLSCVVIDKEVGALNSANLSCNRSVVFVMIVLGVVIVAQVDSAQ